MGVSEGLLFPSIIKIDDKDLLPPLQCVGGQCTRRFLRPSRLVGIGVEMMRGVKRSVLVRGASGLNEFHGESVDCHDIRLKSWGICVQE